MRGPFLSEGEVKILEALLILVITLSTLPSINSTLRCLTPLRETSHLEEVATSTILVLEQSGLISKVIKDGEYRLLSKVISSILAPSFEFNLTVIDLKRKAVVFTYQSPKFEEAFCGSCTFTAGGKALILKISS